MSKEKQNDKKKSSTKEYAKISRKNLLLKSLGIKQLSKKEQKRLGKTIADEQNPDTFCKCKYVGRVLTFSPFAILLLAIMQSIFISDNINSLYFVSIVAVISVVSVLLCLFKPLYFTPWSDDDNKWKSDSMFGTPMVSLSFPIGVSVSICMVYVFTMVHYPDPTLLVLYIVGLGLFLGFLLCIRCRAQRKTLKLIGIMFVVGICVSISIIVLSNAIFANREPFQTYAGEITDKDLFTSSKGHSRIIDVTVYQDEFSFHITKDIYDQYSVGDRIPVYFYSGGLGIPFVDIIKH